MWSLRIVQGSPAFNDHLGFPHIVEYFSIEQLISEFAVEALNISIFPRTSGLNKKRLGPEPRQPLPDCLGGKLGAIVRTYVIRDSPVQKQIRETMHHVLGTEIPGHLDGQAFSGEFIEYREHPERLALVGPCSNKIV